MEKFDPKLILCPTDFSELSSLALQYASRMAGCFGAKLLVLYVDSFMPPPHFTSRQVDHLVNELEHSKQAAREYLAKYVKDQIGNDVGVETVVAEGLPVPSIVTTAQKREVGLVVMGTHGRSGLSRAMLGSVTERVLRETDRPVLTVRPHEGRPRRDQATARKILCPVNFTEISKIALEHAVALTQCLDAELEVIHIQETSGESAILPKTSESLCQWVPEEFRKQCRIKEVVKGGHAAEEIIAAAEEGGCDLIVIGARHKRFFDSTVIGTTTVRVTRHAPCPVLTVVEKKAL